MEKNIKKLDLSEEIDNRITNNEGFYERLTKINPNWRSQLEIEIIIKKLNEIIDFINED